MLEISFFCFVLVPLLVPPTRLVSGNFATGYDRVSIRHPHNLGPKRRAPRDLLYVH
jgi:hypothetical protein